MLLDRPLLPAFTQWEVRSRLVYCGKLSKSKGNRNVGDSGIEREMADL
jgi:hypothetical protein